ncbi:MAG: ATP-dependent metalloprotease, partial [Gammaproteobacteria bacterium]|nr:ATP-dependent metalloprotease [Gammaproteobacteria bacterium]
MNDLAKNMLIWLGIALVLVSVFNNFNPSQTQVRTLEYSTFISDVKRGKVRDVEINPNTREIIGTTKTGEKFRSIIPLGGDNLEKIL